MHDRPNVGPRQGQYSKLLGVTSEKKHNPRGSGTLQPQDIVPLGDWRNAFRVALCRFLMSPDYRRKLPSPPTGTLS
jgi:hypothetical protein